MFKFYHEFASDYFFYTGRTLRSVSDTQTSNLYNHTAKCHILYKHDADLSLYQLDV